MFPSSDNLYGVVRNGVLTLSGYSIIVRVDNGELHIKDGLKGHSEIGLKFNRAHCPVSRLICVRPEGFITFSAVEWLNKVGVVFIQLDYDGKPMMVNLPPGRVVPAAMRRLQASLSTDKPPGRSIAYALIHAKVTRQIAVLRDLGFPGAADEAYVLAERLTPGMSADDLLGIEGRVAALYWMALADMPLQFGRGQRVPDHWRAYGSRRSPLTGTARNAVVPAQAMTNYLLGVLASEITIALHAVGLDPTLGALHLDKDDRASLTYDLIEPARPVLDRYFFHWLRSATFSRRDFRENERGEIKGTHPLNAHLAMTAPLWRGIADQLARWIFERLSAGSASADQSRPVSLSFIDGKNEAGRRAVRWALGNKIERPIPTMCAECGKMLPSRHRKFCSADCMRSWHGGAPVEAGLAAIRRARAAGKKPRPARPPQLPDGVPTIAVWRERPGWSEADDIAMMTWYKAAVVPRLLSMRPRDIRAVTGISATASIQIRLGRRIPHPRWYQLLANMTGVEYPWLGDLKPGKGTGNDRNT
jgi:CRISPR-associated endonuclease Cas1